MNGEKLYEILLGNNLFENELIVARCRDAGLNVKLTRNEHPETGGLVPLGSSYLLVRAADADSVRELLAVPAP